MPRPVHFPPAPPPLAAPTDEPLLPLKAGAHQLGVSIDTLRRLVRRGELVSVKVGQLRRIEPRVLRAYIAQHRTQRAG